jgi:hypothetical protein
MSQGPLEHTQRETTISLQEVNDNIGPGLRYASKARSTSAPW